MADMPLYIWGKTKGDEEGINYYLYNAFLPGGILGAAGKDLDT